MTEYINGAVGRLIEIDWTMIVALIAFAVAVYIGGKLQQTLE